MGAGLPRMLPPGRGTPGAAEQVRQIPGGQAIPAVRTHIIAACCADVLILPLGYQQIGGQRF